MHVPIQNYKIVIGTQRKINANFNLNKINSLYKTKSKTN